MWFQNSKKRARICPLFKLYVNVRRREQQQALARYREREREKQNILQAIYFICIQNLGTTHNHTLQLIDSPSFVFSVFARENIFFIYLYFYIKAYFSQTFQPFKYYYLRLIVFVLSTFKHQQNQKFSPREEIVKRVVEIPRRIDQVVICLKSK